MIDICQMIKWSFLFFVSKQTVSLKTCIHNIPVSPGILFHFPGAVRGRGECKFEVHLLYPLDHLKRGYFSFK